MRKIDYAKTQIRKDTGKGGRKRIALVFDPGSGGEADLIGGIRRFARDKHHWILRLISPRFLSREVLQKWGADALLVSGTPERLPFIPRGFPTIDAAHSDRSRFPYVGFDDCEAGRIAANYLLGKRLEHF